MSGPAHSDRPLRLRALRVAGLVLAATLFTLVVVTTVAVRRPLPSRSGTWSIPGLDAPVNVAFDAAGIPHVDARTGLDAWRALGWLHANDRFFQMELRRRAGAGRLAEVFGSAALDMDREARRSGFLHRAQADAAGLPPDERAVLDAYAEGVNAFLVSRPRPLELVVLGVDPEPWTAIDSLAFGWQLYDALSDSGSREYQVMQALRAHGADVVTRILAASGEDPGTLPEPFASRPAAPRAGPVPPYDDLPRAASNAWAVSPSRSATGSALLASDPHLWREYPAIWYVAHLRAADGLDVAGLTLAGAPGVFIGHNGRVAWGITMQQADDTDLFLEDLDADRMTTREPDGRDAAVSLRQETIRVRGGDAVRETVMETARGTLFVEEGGTLAWSRSWAPDAAQHSLSAFLGFDRAPDGAGLAAAAARYGGPPINVVWADRMGRIGMRTAGSIPVRSKGRGRFPSPAWTGEYRWLGTLPADQLPAIEDPTVGFVASGNDDWSESGGTLPYPGHWASPIRVRRLRTVLGATDRATVDDFRALQNDLVSGYALRVARGLADLRHEGGDVARAVDILSAWDGSVKARGPGALLYPFLVEARREIFEARETRAGAALPAGWEAMASLIDKSAPQSLWDDPGTETVESRESVLAPALANALLAIEKEDGNDPSRWDWGRRHVLSVRHPFSSLVPLLGLLIDPAPLAMPGEWHNPRVAGFGLADARADVQHIASARLLVDLGDFDRSRVVLPLGQAAHIGDPHRFDHLPVWSEGRDFPLPFTPAAVTRASVATMRLVPGNRAESGSGR